MNSLPSGTVTFLFTDIEGSTKLAQEHPNEMPALLARHNEILHQAIQNQSGYVFQIVGDSFSAAFHSATDAVNAAVIAQRSLQTEAWNPAPIKVRIGIHTGEAQLNDEKQYSGYGTIALTQRIMTAGHGRQVLLSSATRELVRDSLPVDAELLDLGEKRLKGLLRPEHLYQLNMAGLPASFPALRTLDSFPNNLPTQLTSFIGREREIAEVKHELDEHRLVTLTGSGGTGKTRLSLQVAADLLEKFDHGIWFVELAPLADPDLIPQTILAAIGIQERSGQKPLDVLKEYFQEKQALIVLDNCEHLVTTSAQVVNTLLNAAPRLRVLASSREVLGVRGELSYPVPSLSLPDIKNLPVIEQLSQYEAVRLFIDRALLVAPHFVVDKDNAPFIAQICHRLDGIPLALELAAARVKVLSVEQISNRLDDRFRLLTGGARTALPRQQTLRALIDWSYDILSENERLLLRRLSVFAGGWTLETAEDVCSDQASVHSETADHHLLVTDILDLLTQLVNKSLVVVVDQESGSEMRYPAAGPLRYRMLETIRQYARERLLESDGGADVRDRHFDHYLRKAWQAKLEYFSSRGLKWLSWFNNEWDNLRAAMEWSIEKYPVTGLELANCIGYIYLGDFHHANDMDNWLSQLLVSPENLERTAGRALGLLHFAWYAAASREDNVPSGIMLEESISICRELGDRYVLAYAYLAMALTGNNPGGFYEKAVRLFRETQHKPGLALTLLYQGWFHPSNDQRLKRASLLESQSLYGELGYIIGRIETLKQLGAIDLRLGDFASAQRWLDEAQSVVQDHQASLRNSITVSYDLGDLAYFEGRYELAQKHYEGALAWANQIGVPWSTAWANVRLGYLYTKLEERQNARLFLGEALHTFQKLSMETGVAIALEGFAMLAVIERQWEKAVQLFSFAAKQREQFHSPRAPVEQASIDRDLASLRASLSEAEFSNLLAEGSTMTLEHVVAVALEE